MFLWELIVYSQLQLNDGGVSLSVSELWECILSSQLVYTCACVLRKYSTYLWRLWHLWTVPMYPLPTHARVCAHMHIWSTLRIDLFEQ